MNHFDATSRAAARATASHFGASGHFVTYLKYRVHPVICCFWIPWNVFVFTKVNNDSRQDICCAVHTEHEWCKRSFLLCTVLCKNVRRSKRLSMNSSHFCCLKEADRWMWGALSVAETSDWICRRAEARQSKAARWKEPSLCSPSLLCIDLFSLLLRLPFRLESFIDS